MSSRQYARRKFLENVFKKHKTYLNGKSWLFILKSVKESIGLLLEIYKKNGVYINLNETIFNKNNKIFNDENFIECFTWAKELLGFNCEIKIDDFKKYITKLRKNYYKADFIINELNSFMEFIKMIENLNFYGLDTEKKKDLAIKFIILGRIFSYYMDLILFEMMPRMLFMNPKKSGEYMKELWNIYFKYFSNSIKNPASDVVYKKFKKLLPKLTVYFILLKLDKNSNYYDFFRYIYNNMGNLSDIMMKILKTIPWSKISELHEMDVNHEGIILKIFYYIGEEMLKPFINAYIKTITYIKLEESEDNNLITYIVEYLKNINWKEVYEKYKIPNVGEMIGQLKDKDLKEECYKAVANVLIIDSSCCPLFRSRQKIINYG